MGSLRVIHFGKFYRKFYSKQSEGIFMSMIKWVVKSELLTEVCDSRNEARNLKRALKSEGVPTVIERQEFKLVNKAIIR